MASFKPIAAALSGKQSGAVQELPNAVLRERLLAQNQVLDLPVLELARS